MPAKSRPGRPTFGGKLLAVPTPLPDDPDDEAPPPQDSAPAAEEPLPAQPTEPTPAPNHASAASPSPRRPTRERPPGTIRLDDRAGQALWDAYVEAKTQDPFLSYRQFASQIILDGLTAGQVSYDLRRLRAHGLISRITGSHRYRITDTGLHHATLLTHIHTRLLQPGLAHLTDPDPPKSSPLRSAARNYQRALSQLTQNAGLPHEPDLTRSNRLRRP